MPSRRSHETVGGSDPGSGVRDCRAASASSSSSRSISVPASVAAAKGRSDELRAALDRVRETQEHAIAALMVTDILSHSTDLIVSGNAAGQVERAFDAQIENGVLPLPGVMSRKKQVAPKLLAAFR